MRYPQMGTKGLVCPEFPWMIPQAVPAQGLQAVGLQIQIWKEFSSNRSKGFYLTLIWGVCMFSAMLSVNLVLFRCWAVVMGIISGHEIIQNFLVSKCKTSQATTLPPKAVTSCCLLTVAASSWQ